MLTKFSKRYFEKLFSLIENAKLLYRDYNVSKISIYTIGCYGLHVTNDAKNISYKAYNLILAQKLLKPKQ